MIFPIRRCAVWCATLVFVTLSLVLSAADAVAQSEPGLPELTLDITDVQQTAKATGANIVSPLRLRARFLMDPGAPPQSQGGLLQIEARIDPGFHIGSLTQQPGGPKATAVHLEPNDSIHVEGFRPNVEPTVMPADLFPVPEEYHTGTVVWSSPFQLAAGVDPNTLLVQGYLSGQACEEGKSCRDLSKNLTAFTARFEGMLTPPSPPDAVEPEPIQQVTATSELELFPPLPTFAPAPVLNSTPIPVLKSGPPMPQPMPVLAQAAVETAAPAASSGLATTAYYFGLAFVAGFILNFMPCVLPVIGLKVMSFVQQAGESRSRVLTLNIFFVLGLLTVFMLLACLSAFLGYGWGQLFQSPKFSIAMVCIVFVFALSMLGIWELPSPSFAGRGSAVDLAEKEGVSGAFFKGVLTTLLATPCTGPMLAPALGWAVKQPKPIIFGSFLFMGLGMGIPYILFALSPRLMSLLPKPGAWMDTFKQVMGFVLLGTVVWLFYGMSSAYVVPTIALIFTLWAACWAIGRVPITASSQTKSVNYLGALAFAAIVGYFSFVSLISEPATFAGNDGKRFVSAADVDFDGEWPVYTKREDIDHFIDNGVPVFVDFTAKW